MKAFITAIQRKDYKPQVKEKPYSVTMSYTVEFTGTGDLSEYVKIMKEEPLKDPLMWALFKKLESIEF